MMKEKFIISLISKFGSYIANTIAFFCLAIRMNIELIGIWFFLESIINLGFTFNDLGFSSIHYQFSSKENFDNYYGSFFLIKILLILINIVFTTCLIIIFQLWSDEYYNILLLLLLSQTILSITYILTNHLKAKRKIFKSEIPFFLIELGKSIAIISLSFNISNIINPLQFLCFLYLISNFIFILFVLILSKNDFKICKPKKNFILNYLKETKPLILNSILLVLVSNISKIIINYSFGPEVLAYVWLVDKIIPILLIISGSWGPLYIGIYSKYFKRNNLYAIEKMTHIIEKYSSILFLSIILIAFLNAELFLSIFLPSYLNSLPILYIMIFIPYLYGLTRPYEHQMIPGEKQNIYASLRIFTHILQLILIIILIPENFFILNMVGLGPLGYAIALLIPNILYAIISRYVSRKYFNIKSQKRIFLHCLFMIFSFISSFLLKKYVLIFFIENEILLLLISTAFALSIFFGGLLIFKDLKKNDINFFLNLLNIKRYKKSFKEEFQ